MRINETTTRILLCTLITLSPAGMACAGTAGKEVSEQDTTYRAAPREVVSSVATYEPNNTSYGRGGTTKGRVYQLFCPVDDSVVEQHFVGAVLTLIQREICDVWGGSRDSG